MSTEDGPDFLEAECFHHRSSSLCEPYVKIQLNNGSILHLKVDYEYLQPPQNLNGYDEQWDLLTQNELAECMHLTFKELNQSLTGLVSCLRCRSCIKQVMRRAVDNYDLDDEGISDQQIYPLCWHGPSCVSLHQQFICKCHSSRTYNLLNQPSHHSNEGKLRKTKQTLCSFHKKFRPKLDCSWVDLWDKLDGEQRRKITELQRLSFERRLKRYVDCSDCHAYIYGAYALISGITEQVEFNWDETRKEQTKGFSLEVTEKKIFLPMQLEHIAELMGKAEDEKNWEAKRDHTRGWLQSLHVVQVVLGMMLWEQFESLWIQLRREKHTMQCFVQSCLKCFQKKIDFKIHERAGAARLKALIDSLENENNAADNGKKKKKKKRRKKKRVQKNQQKEPLKANSETAKSYYYNKVDEDESLSSLQKENIHEQALPAVESTLRSSVTVQKQCEVCGENEIKWNDGELLFLQTLGWSEKNRKVWEAEPLANKDQDPLWLEIGQKERTHCRQCLLNRWQKYCGNS